MTPTRRPRLFEHQDLPLFTGQAPTVHQPVILPSGPSASQLTLVPYRVYPHRPLMGFPAMDCFNCGIGDPVQIWHGCPVEIVETSKADPDRALVRTVDGHVLYAWIDRNIIE